MKLNYNLPIALIGTSFALVQSQQAIALSPLKIDDIAQKVTVLIESDSRGYGSGVIINKKGNTYTILTSAHVVDEEITQYRIVTHDKQVHAVESKTIKQLPGVDLAIFQFTSKKNYKVATLGDSDSIQRNQQIFIAGFPKKTAVVSRQIYHFVQGQVIANATKEEPISDEGYGLVYDNATLPGMSGGPIFNQQGEVIGIHGKGERFNYERSRVDLRVAIVKSGRNLGIPIKTYLQLASQAKTMHTASLPRTNRPKLEYQPQSINPPIKRSSIPLSTTSTLITPTTNYLVNKLFSEKATDIFEVNCVSLSNCASTLHNSKFYRPVKFLHQTQNK